MGKDKMLRDLLARDDEKKSDALHDLHEYELPPRATGKEHDPTLHDLLHKMDTLTLELTQLKDGSKLTDLETTITGLSYLGNKRSPFVQRQTHGKLTPLFKKSVQIKTLHKAHLHGLRLLACLVLPTEPQTEDSEEEGERRKERKGVATAKIETSLLVFTGRNIVFWAKDFARFLRLTGQTKASDMIKADLVVTECRTDWLRELLEDLLSQSNTFVEFLAEIGETFPVFETDMHIRQQLLDLSKFKEFPKLEEINQMEARDSKLVARLTCVYSKYAKLILLRSKIRAKTWPECKDTPARKALTHSYSDLLRPLKALFMERESVQAADRHAHLNYAQYNAEAELFTGKGKGEDKGSGKGKGKGLRRGGGKGKGGGGWQWTQEHPPPAFKVTIYCEYCGKENDAALNCWKKRKYDTKQQEGWDAQQQAQQQG